jgi:GNAT superfamily N-acetyltransferase
MIQLFQYPQGNCPKDISTQIVELLRAEWPNTFKQAGPDWPTESAELKPTSIVLVDNGVVISHAAVLRKTINHCAENYLAFGLGSVVTRQSLRRRGFGRRIVEHATHYMKQEDADLGVFTCDSHLAAFYVFGGWEVTLSSPLVGGTIEEPLPSERVGKLTIIQLFSEKAKKLREKILSRPITIELGKGKLW